MTAIFDTIMHLWEYLSSFDFHLWFTYDFPIYKYLAPVFIVIGGFFICQIVDKVLSLFTLHIRFAL